jgi:hypothetical protein
LTIGDPSYKTGSVIHRVKINGTTATNVGLTELEESFEVFEGWIQGNTVIGPEDGPSISTVGLWHYPRGGKPTGTLSKGSSGFFNGAIGVQSRPLPKSVVLPGFLAGPVPRKSLPIPTVSNPSVTKCDRTHSLQGVLGATFERPIVAVRAAPTSGTTTFAFTDIEGSTVRWERDRTAMHEAVRRHDAIVRRAIEQCGGHVFKAVGDGFFSAFARPQDAVAAMLAAQRALLDEDFSAVDGLRVRGAVHTGIAAERRRALLLPMLRAPVVIGKQQRPRRGASAP